MVGAVAGEQLRVSEGQDSGQTISVDSEILFGRGSTDELGRLGDDPLLSRRHARIGRGPGGQLIVEDLGSANGTFVNDQRIEGVYTLALGDRVRVGGTVFQVTDAGGNVPAKTQLSDSPPPREAAPAAQPAPPPPPPPRPRSCWSPAACRRASAWASATRSSWAARPPRTAASARTRASRAATRGWRATPRAAS